MLYGFRIPPPDGGSVSKLSHGVNHIHSRFGNARAEYAGRTGTSLRTTVAPGAGKRFLRCRFPMGFYSIGVPGERTHVLRLVRLERIR